MGRSCRLLPCAKLSLILGIIGCYAVQISAATIGRQGIGSQTVHRQVIRSAHGRLNSQQKEHAARSMHYAPYNVSSNGTWSPDIQPSEQGQHSSPETNSHSTRYDEPASNLCGTDLTPSLPQQITNGNSFLGTKPVRRYHRRTTTSSNSGNSSDANASGVPSTGSDVSIGGVTRRYDFYVDYAEIAPDGVTRQAILINGAFPGPTIEANYGDWIEVSVTNLMTDEGTTIHWHGMLQKITPWMDGVPSIQQCPIAPGRTFTYRFQADQVGTTWWHSHFSGQYTSGAYGALIIHGPNENQGYDADLGPVFLSDWYHEPLADSLQTTMHSLSSLPPTADNLLINGKMNFRCDTTSKPCVPNAGISKFFFSPSKKYRLRLINSGAATNAKFSIDGHSFTVIAQDLIPIEPYQTDLISLANGQRTDVIVEAVGVPGSSYWMRYDIGDGTNPNACISVDGSNVRSAVAAVYYDGADENSVPLTTSSIDPARLLACANDPLQQTIPVQAISSEPQGQLTTIEMHINFTHSFFPAVLNEWTINGAGYHADYSRSLLADVKYGNDSSLADTLNLFDFGEAGTVRIILYDHFVFTHHPMHLHGYNFQVLAEGWGVWDGTITNPGNPSRRDVQVLNKAILLDGAVLPAYTVIQFFATNPGVWPFHCHMAWHNSAGLFSNLLIKPTEIQGWQVPDTIAQTCVDWNNFQAATNYQQVDAGI